MTSAEFIYGAFDLFTATLSAVLSEPLLASFAIVLLALAVIVLIGVTVRGAKKE